MALVPGARSFDLPGGVHAAWSDASRGDLRPTGAGPDDGAPLGAFALELAVAGGCRIDRVAWVTQVHGSQVHAVRPDVAAPTSRARHGLWHLGEGDALVSDSPGTALCILTADCAPLALASPEGIFAAVHAGWRGLLAGVVEAAVDRMRGWGATDVVGALGPSIHADCYQFGAADLKAVAAVYGDVVRATDRSGQPALDLPAGIGAALDRAGARRAAGVDACTACGAGWFSHRAHADTGRQALVVWSDRTEAG